MTQTPQIHEKQYPRLSSSKTILVHCSSHIERTTYTWNNSEKQISKIWSHLSYHQVETTQKQDTYLRGAEALGFVVSSGQNAKF